MVELKHRRMLIWLIPGWQLTKGAFIYGFARVGAFANTGLILAV